MYLSRASSSLFAPVSLTTLLQAESFLHHLDPVVDQLRDELPQANYDRRGLGQLIGQFMQFQEDALGINVSTF